MRLILCENNKSDSKYWQGKRCYEQILVDDRTVSVWCWKCVSNMMPIEPPKPKSGYPRGWKFMNEFVDNDGNVYHKGELQEELFGSKDPTPIKETQSPIRKKKKASFDDKVIVEMNKKLHNKRISDTKRKLKTTSDPIPKNKNTKKYQTHKNIENWFDIDGVDVTISSKNTSFDKMKSRATKSTKNKD